MTVTCFTFLIIFIFTLHFSFFLLPFSLFAFSYLFLSFSFFFLFFSFFLFSFPFFFFSFLLFSRDRERDFDRFLSFLRSSLSSFLGDLDRSLFFFSFSFL